MQRNNSLSVLLSIGIAAVVTILVTAIMLPLIQGNILPIDKPFAVVFAKSIFGQSTPLPVGVGLHLVYVLFWSSIFMLFLTRRPFANAVYLAGGLWILQAAVMYPLVGWGFFGTAVSAAQALITLVPHAILALLLWIAGSITAEKFGNTSATDASVGGDDMALKNANRHE